jgi:hypothetical protein
MPSGPDRWRSHAKCGEGGFYDISSPWRSTYVEGLQEIASPREEADVSGFRQATAPNLSATIGAASIGELILSDLKGPIRRRDLLGIVGAHSRQGSVGDTQFQKQVSLER